MTKEVRFPKGSRHGTAFKVADEVVERLKREAALARRGSCGRRRLNGADDQGHLRSFGGDGGWVVFVFERCFGMLARRGRRSSCSRS